MIRIGAIGHRFFYDDHTTEFVTKQCISILRQAKESYENVVAISALAEGADMIFAEVASLLDIPIEIVRPFHLEKEVKGKKALFADVRELDLSGAEARNAYWAKSDFSYADFFSADLSKTSFRASVLSGAQFKDANLTDAVLIDALCHNANFDGAKVNGMNVQGADLTGVDTDIFVDASRDAKNANMIRFGEWLRQNGFC